jgi:small conductance mechanosensitive channel
MFSFEALDRLATYVFTVVLPGIIGAALTLVIGNWLLRLLVRVAGAAATRARIKPALVDLMKAAITAIGWIFIFAGVLQSLGMNEIAIALGGTIGLVALGISSAASGNLGDIIAGVFLASDPDFGTGFQITTGNGDNRLTGVIERIDLRKTRIRGTDGKLHIVPNKQIENNIWVVERSFGAPDLAGRRSPQAD